MAGILTYVEDAFATFSVFELSEDHRLVAPVLHVTVLVPPVAPVGTRVRRGHIVGMSTALDGKTSHIDTAVAVERCS